jgi:hypothetical protein
LIQDDIKDDSSCDIDINFDNDDFFEIKKDKDAEIN